MLKAYRQRWIGIETFHRNGRRHLGMGEYHLRDGNGQIWHMYLVFLACSAMMSELRQARPREWAQGVLTAVGRPVV